MVREVIGTSIGPYRILALLGAGGMGEVYRAHDPRLRRDVAIKILHDAALDAERLGRFQREAQILAALDHRHIAGIYGVEQLDGASALVLEFVDGLTLAERIAKGPIPVSEALTIARQIADAVETAHEQGIIHRDLKPANIKIRPDGVVKVLDFGLARIESEPVPSGVDPITVTSVATRAGVVMGTAAYMSPEQARGQPVDKRTDIWAFGCVLFEMLTGRCLFHGASVSDTIANVLRLDPDLTLLPPATPAAVRDLVRRCLQKDVRHRLRDLGDARILLDEALVSSNDSWTSGPTEVSGRDFQRATGTRRLPLSPPLTLIAVALASAALTYGLVKLAGRETTASAPPAFDRFIRLIASDAHEFAPAISPDGKWVTYLSNARGPADVWLKFISGGDAVNLTAGLDVGVQLYGAIGGVEISPDGTQLAFVAGPPDAAPFQMMTWTIPAPLGGVPRKLIVGQGMRWSADGKRIAYILPGGPSGDTLVVADADGQNGRDIVPPRGGNHIHWPRWSPDGRFLYFNYGFQNANSEPTEIYRVRSEGGEPEAVVKTVRRAVFPLPTPDGRGFFFAANPGTVDAALWWRDLATGRDHMVTTGVGDYSAPQISNDGNRLIAGVSDPRQALIRIPIDFDRAPVFQPLTDGFSGDFDPSWSPDGTRLVFSSSRTGNRNLWSARADLSRAVPLTTGGAIDERPAYSRDGQQIAFVSDRGGQRGIWIVSADGGAPKSVIKADVIDSISWSPDGKRIVYSEPGPKVPQLTTVDVATGKATVLPTARSATAPAWSPAADVIAYIETEPGIGAFLKLMSGDGKPDPRPLPHKVTRLSNGSLSWSADGRRLAGVGLPGAQRASVWIIEPDSPSPFRKLTELPADVSVRGVTWTPDGSLLIGQVKFTGDIVLAERLR